MTNELQVQCSKHGTTTGIASKDRGRTRRRCRQCNVDSVLARRRANKVLLVSEAGGACVRCGYSRSVAALQFHHVNPALKSFGLSDGGFTRSITKMREEVKKCVLLCANCHAEEHSQVADR